MYKCANQTGGGKGHLVFKKKAPLRIAGLKSAKNGNSK
jgi:hypothetical protein